MVDRLAGLNNAIYEAAPAIVDRVRTDGAWLRGLKETLRSGTGQQPMPETYLRAVTERVRTHAEAAERAQAREARYRADHVCRVLGVVGDSTRPRPLPWSAPGEKVRVSDLGLAALLAAWQEALTAGELAAARRYVAEDAPPAPQGDEETNRRRGR